MINQAIGYQPRIWVDSRLWPAVTDLTMEAAHPLSQGQYDLTQTNYLVTLRRRLPVGLAADNLYPKSDFTLTVLDGWNTFVFSHCDWVSVEREVDAKGATEVAKIRATSLSLS